MARRPGARISSGDFPLHGDADRYNHRDVNDDYTQPGNLFRLFDVGQKQRLFENIAAAMPCVPEVIQYRQIGLFAKCDPAYGAGVAKALNLDPAGRNRAKDIGAGDKPEEASLRAPAATGPSNLSL